MGNRTALLKAEALRVTRKVKGGLKDVLHHISFSLFEGETVLLKGGSGAGKTTLLWALARMLSLGEGSLYLKDRPAADWPVQQWRSRVALVLQEHAPLPGTIRENLLLPWQLKIRRKPEDGGSGRAVRPPDEATLLKELKAHGLDDVDLDENASRLSQGQKARIAQARAQLLEPDCLLLDEPLAALDPDSASKVMKRIQCFADGGGAVLITGHWIDEDAAGKTFYLDNGTIEECE
ncbi:MAG: ATP-binding cassette domain-containing protein [Planctomycetota bacterium]